MDPSYVWEEGALLTMLRGFLKINLNKLDPNKAKCIIKLNFIILQFFFFFCERVSISFQPMVSAPNYRYFIIKPKHQLIFSVGRDWTPGLIQSSEILPVELTGTHLLYYMLGSKVLVFYVFRTLICIVGKPWSKQCV